MQDTPQNDNPLANDNAMGDQNQNDLGSAPVQPVNDGTENQNPVSDVPAPSPSPDQAPEEEGDLISSLPVDELEDDEPPVVGDQPEEPVSEDDQSV